MITIPTVIRGIVPGSSTFPYRCITCSNLVGVNVAVDCEWCQELVCRDCRITFPLAGLMDAGNFCSLACMQLVIENDRSTI